MPKSLWQTCLEKNHASLLEFYDLLTRRSIYQRESEDGDTAGLHARIVRGIILARLLDLDTRPPFKISQTAVCDNVSSPVNCPFEVTPWEVGTKLKVSDMTYEQGEWLVSFQGISDYQLHKASDFRDELRLSRHFIPSSGIRA